MPEASNFEVLTSGERMKVLAAVFVLLSSLASAQSVASAPPNDHAVILVSLEQTSYSTIAQLQAMRIDKWKTESAQKQQARQNAESLIRNMTAALPGMVAAARASPQNFAANFKLYRNVSALYDVLLQLTESAGAFGSKGEFQGLGEQLERWDGSRRAFGDYLERLAVFKDVAANASAPTAARPAKPKKVIVDDTEPAPRKKKK